MAETSQTTLSFWCKGLRNRGTCEVGTSLLAPPFLRLVRRIGPTFILLKVRSQGVVLRDAFDSDRTLVRRMLSGEERAFEQFFEANFSGLYRFALLRMGNDGEAAEEVAQATLCAAVNKLESYRGEAALFTWLCTFCRHEISAFCRKRNRAPVAFGSTEEQPWIREALDAMQDERLPLPEELLSRKELKALVREALNRLPPHYGDALEWKYIEGCAVNEIAKRMKMSPKAAESLLTRAREAFREAFTSTCSGEPETEME